MRRSRKFVRGTVAVPLALSGILVALATGCGRPSGSDDRPIVDEGKRRMTELLQRLAEEGDEDNPYLGRKLEREVEEQLATLSEGVPDLRRWLFHRVLGLRDLRLGLTESSIEHYEIAYAQLAVFAGEIPPNEQLRTIYEVGVAHLRDGENRNCSRRHTAESCILPIRGGGIHTDREGSTQAIRYFTEVLERAPRDSYYHVKARWLLNLAYMTLGEYPDGVPDAWLVPPAAFDSDEALPHFENIAPRLGLDTIDLAGGAIAEDFDGDEDLDLIVTTSDTRGQMRYWRNNADGTFTERTEEAGLDGLWGGLNAIQADYDNDGDVDVLVLRGAWWRAQGRHPNSLLRNEGDGTFRDVTFEAGLGEVFYPTQTAAWADYDNDGDLDLYIGNETDAELEAPCQLFRNEGDGHFVDVAATAGVENLRFAKAVVWGDYDADGDPDLYVSNIGDRNRLYRNEGDGRFTDVADETGVTGPVSSFIAWFWDANNDGALDLLVSAYGGVRLAPDVVFVAASYLGMAPNAETPRLYLGDGQGRLVDASSRWNLGRVTLPMGSNFGDLDYDGWLDFYFGTGYPFYEGLMPNIMYRNRAGTGFADVTTAGGFGHLQKGHGVVFADLDQDGDQDVFEQMGGFYPGDAAPNVLFENPGFGHHWIKLRLVGRQSNRSGIGARLRLDVSENGRARTIWRWVGTGGTFGGNPLRQEIGLGDAARVERLEVYWPTSGMTQRFDDVAADRSWIVTEGRDSLDAAPHVAFPFRR